MSASPRPRDRGHETVSPRETVAAGRPLPVPRGERRCIDCGRRCKILRCERCLARDQQREATRERNKAKLADQKREYYQRNKAKLADQKREYYQRNKAKLADRKREYYQRNKVPLTPMCAGCGSPLRYGGRGRPPVWCGGRSGCVNRQPPRRSATHA